MSTVLVTGSSGLVGSACVSHFSALGWLVVGIDGNQRRDYFGADGDTTPTLARQQDTLHDFRHYHLDVRNPLAILGIFRKFKPALVIHAAAQPSHDLAARLPVLDFETNAVGTLNMLEATRLTVPDAVFVFLSTNKVYGDEPNSLPLIERETRYDYHRASVHGIEEFLESVWPGVDETYSVDQSTHSLFGCSKLAADLYTQEYGRYFGMKTVCFRAGCLTGSGHAGAEQHGFLAYLARCVKEGRPYTIHGYKGKQVRDQLHAFDVARACELFAQNPRSGEVYNLGGGRDNSVSVLEAIDLFEQATGKRLERRYEEEPRRGDHCVYISDCSKFRSHYPDWSVTVSLGEIVEELARGGVS